MKNRWPVVPLARVLRYRKEFIEINDLEIYKRCRVQLNAQGIVLRDQVAGAEIKTKRQQVCRAGELLVAEIDAKVGGYGIVPRELEGAIVSSHYFLFAVDETVLDRKFLSYFIRTPAFHEQIVAQGSTNYAAIRSQYVLTYKIPLPSLPEQHRIVAHIEYLATKIEECHNLRNVVLAQTKLLLDAEMYQIFEADEMSKFKYKVKDSGLILNKETRNPTIEIENKEFRYVDISSVVSSPCILTEARKISCYQAPSRARKVIHENDIIISTVRINLRAIAKVGAPLNNQICSTGFAVFSCPPNIDADFILYQLYSPFFINQCVKYSTGGHYPAINDSNLKEVFLIIPPLPEQRQIAAHLKYINHKVALANEFQGKLQLQLNALLPSILDKTFMSHQ